MTHPCLHRPRQSQAAGNANNYVCGCVALTGAQIANLDAQSPVSLGLAGHTAVADGYGYASGVLYTHINFGWGGAANAWYNLPEVEVDESGINYSSSILDAVEYLIPPGFSGGGLIFPDSDPVRFYKLKVEEE